MKRMIDNRFLTCMFCPDLCLDRCPVVAATGDTTNSPFSKMSLAGLLQSGLVFADTENTLLLYQCTACMACTEFCEHSIDVANALLDTRKNLISKGINPVGQDLFQQDRDFLMSRLRKGFPAAWFNPGLQGLLLPGTEMLKGAVRQMKAVASMLKGLDIQYVETSDLSAESTGYSLYAAGFHDSFLHLAKAFYARLRRYKVVVTPSPVVEYTLKFIYPLFGISGGPQIRSLTEVIHPLILARKDARSLHVRTVFHDCSFSGRYMGRYDPQREILAHITHIRPMEMRRSRQDAMGCGYGGGFQVVFPDEALAAAEEVIRMAMDTGADVLVTEAPECYNLMQAAAKKLRNGIRIRLLYDLVYEWIRQNR